jgi:uncharacterized protein (DUF169 family)
MASTSHNFSVLNRFNFQRKPIGVKFLASRPNGIEILKKELNFCEMIKEAQESESFYVAPNQWLCVEPYLLGFKDFEPIYISGMVGGEVGLFREARANRQLYLHLPKMLKDSVKYVAFAPTDKLTFDPDVLILTATMNQAPTLLRALNYSSGEPIVSKTTPVVACSWIMIYPVLSSEMNYVVTGLGLGMKALNVFPAGLFLISIPWQKIPTALENLFLIPYEEGDPKPGPGGVVHRQRIEVLENNLRKRMAE